MAPQATSNKVLHSGLFVKLLKKDTSIRFLRIFCRTGIVNCVQLSNWMVLLVTYFIFTAGYDKVEYYHLCCVVYGWQSKNYGCLVMEHIWV